MNPRGIISKNQLPLSMTNSLCIVPALTKVNWVYFFILQVDTVDGKTVKVTKKTLPCTLDEATSGFIKLIFSNDMFKEAMECMNLGGCVSVNKSFCTNWFMDCANVSIFKYLYCYMPVGLECLLHV